MSQCADAPPGVSFLPDVIPVLDGVTAARRQRSGGIDGEAGGDWADVIRLSGGRVALVVGDVVGRGEAAAMARGQLRAAILMLALLDLSPEVVLGHLDDLAREHDRAQLATCVYAVHDPVERRLRYASAGHLPPVLQTPGSAPRLLPVPGGAPLGVGGVGFEVAEAAVPEGAVLVLCTDGLVESRDTGLDTGLAGLLEVVRSAARPGGTDEPGPLADLILDGGASAAGAGDGDDVALLVARLETMPPDRQAAWDVVGDVAAVPLVRERVTRQLDIWGLAALADTAALLVSEVVTNAIRYARTPIVLSMLSLRDRVEVAVSDGDGRLPRLRPAGARDEGGRGLALVEALSNRWGARPTGTGKVVWFSLGRPGA